MIHRNSAVQEQRRIRRPGHAKASVIGRCTVCGRDDVRMRPGSPRASGGGTFHYAPPPCELPCAGGDRPSDRNLAEDAPDGFHTKDCRRCRRKASA